MTKIAIIIPARLDARRLPNKPLKLIKNKEMILHVHDLATSAKIGDVIVATPDQKILELVKNYGGQAMMTNKDHKTGTDRIYEVFKKELFKTHKIIINLQGDMPNLNPIVIKNLVNHIKKNTCDIATIASKLNKNKDLEDENVCKVISKKEIKNNEFATALDFFRLTKNKTPNFTYHHIGIYAFTSASLIRYVSLERSKLEIDRNLEQLRALDNKMKIEVGYTDNCPLSIDTEKDLKKIKEIMEKDDKN